MKTFIVEMDETEPCDYTGCDWDHCTGDLNNRPTWCPLREYKKPRDGMCPDELHAQIMREIGE